MDAKVRGIIDGKLADLPKRMKIVRRRNHIDQKEMKNIPKQTKSARKGVKKRLYWRIFLLH